MTTTIEQEVTLATTRKRKRRYDDARKCLPSIIRLRVGIPRDNVIVDMVAGNVDTMVDNEYESVTFSYDGKSPTLCLIDQPNVSFISYNEMSSNFNSNSQYECVNDDDLRAIITNHFHCHFREMERENIKRINIELVKYRDALSSHGVQTSDDIHEDVTWLTNMLHRRCQAFVRFGNGSQDVQLRIETTAARRIQELPTRELSLAVLTWAQCAANRVMVIVYKLRARDIHNSFGPPLRVMKIIGPRRVRNRISNHEKEVAEILESFTNNNADDSVVTNIRPGEACLTIANGTRQYVFYFTISTIDVEELQLENRLIIFVSSSITKLIDLYHTEYVASLPTYGYATITVASRRRVLTPRCRFPQVLTTGEERATAVGDRAELKEWILHVADNAISTAIEFVHRNYAVVEAEEYDMMIIPELHKVTSIPVVICGVIFDFIRS